MRAERKSLRGGGDGWRRPCLEFIGVRVQGMMELRCLRQVETGPEGGWSAQVESNKSRGRPRSIQRQHQQGSFVLRSLLPSSFLDGLFSAASGAAPTLLLHTSAPA